DQEVAVVLDDDEIRNGAQRHCGKARCVSVLPNLPHPIRVFVEAPHGRIDNPLRVYGKTQGDTVVAWVDVGEKRHLSGTRDSNNVTGKPESNVQVSLLRENQTFAEIVARIVQYAFHGEIRDLPGRGHGSVGRCDSINGTSVTGIDG